MELKQCAGEPGKESGRFHTTQRVGTPSPHRWKPMMGSIVAAYYSLDRRLHYSVSVIQGGDRQAWTGSQSGDLKAKAIEK